MSKKGRRVYNMLGGFSFIGLKLYENKQKIHTFQAIIYRLGDCINYIRKVMIIKTGKFLAGTVAALFSLFVLLVIAGALFLAHAPTRMEFVAPRIQNALNNLGFPISVKIEDVALSFDGDGERMFVFQAKNVQLSDNKGGAIASAPQLGLRFSVLPLLRGQLVPSYINIIRPKLKIVRAEDGSVLLGASDSEVGGGGSPSMIKELLRGLYEAENYEQAAGYLQFVRITDAVVMIEDRKLGVLWVAKHANIKIDRGSDGLKGNISGRISLAEDQSLSLSLNISKKYADKYLTVGGSFSGLDTEVLRSLLPEVKFLQDTSLVLNGSGKAEIDKDLVLKHAKISIRGGDGRISLPDVLQKPINVSSVALDASTDDNAEVIKIERLRLQTNETVARLSGAAKRDGVRYVVSGEGWLNRLPVDKIGAYWPIGVAENAQKWIVENLSGGMADVARIKLEGSIETALPLKMNIDAVHGGIDFSGINVHYLGNLPEVRGVSGKADFDKNRFSLSISEGHTGKLNVQGAEIAITGLDAKDQLIAINLPVKGPTSEALALLDYKPLGYAKRFGFDHRKFSGDVEVNAHFAFPLLAALKLEEVEIKAEAKLDKLGIRDVLERADFENGQLNISLDKYAMAVSGNGDVRGEPFKIDWREDFSQNGGTTLNINGRVTERTFSDLGLGEVAEYVSGVMPIKVRTEPSSARMAKASVSVDLSAVNLKTPIGSKVAAGKDAFAKAELTLSGRKVKSLDKFNIAAAGLAIDGNAVFDGAGKLEKIIVDKVKGEKNDFSLTAEKISGGAFSIVVRGDTLNLGNIFDNVSKLDVAKSTGRRTPLKLDILLKKMILSKTIEFREVSFKGDRQGYGWQDMKLGALAAGGKYIAANYNGGKDTNGLLVTISAPAGSSEKPGMVTVNWRGDQKAADVDGLLEIRTDGNQKILAELADSMSFKGLAGLLADKRIGFDKIKTRVKFSDGGISFTKGHTIGGDLGLTFDGLINTKANKVNVSGTIVPVQGINKIISHIPLFGALIAGGEGQGMFAITYSVKGSLNNPKLTVNPLAIVAPGLLRRILFASSAPKEID